MPNEKITIVGKSGTGKATIFNLLLRLFDPNDDEGNSKITVDSVDLNTIGL